MNFWDAVTWLSAAALTISACVIFVLFLRDARGIFGGGDKGARDE